MKLRSGAIMNEPPLQYDSFLQELQQKINEEETQIQIKNTFNDELSVLFDKISECKVKKNRIHLILQTLTYLENNILKLIENKKYTKKIFVWLVYLDEQSFRIKALNRFTIRSILLLRFQINKIQKLIINYIL
jgi:hypothetical protein